MTSNTPIRDLPAHKLLVNRIRVQNGDFGSASGIALGHLNRFIEQHNIRDALNTQLISISPNAPTEPVVYYEPGYEIINETTVVEALSAAGIQTEGEGEGILIRSVSAGKWFVYLHRGSYAQLGKSWEQAFEEMQRGGEQLNEKLGPQERYVNDCRSVPEKDLLVEIFIPVV